MTSRRPAIFAHRGASSTAPENTIEAFRLARELGADGVELDARRTADGVVVVHHDATVPGTDTPVIAMTRRQLAGVAPHVPDLVDALAACEGLEVDIEIKNAPFDPDWDPDDQTLASTIPLLDETHFISSFNVETVQRARADGKRCGWLLLRSMDPLEVLADWPGYEFVLPGVEQLAPARCEPVVAAARAAGTAVGVWTVDDPAEIRRLAEADVDLVFTNDVALARSALD